MAASFVRALLRHRLLTTVLLLATMALATYSSRTIRARFQFSDYFDYPGVPELDSLKTDSDEFGDPAGYVVAMVEAPDVFQPDVLQYIDRLTKVLEPQRIFGRVRSLTNVNSVRGKDGEVVSGTLIPQLPKTAEEVAEVRSYALASPMLLRRLVSADGTATSVLAQMRTPAALADSAEQTAALDAVEQAVRDVPAPAGVRVRVTGAPTVEVGTTRAIIQDQFRLIPAVTIALIVMLYLMFRSWHGIVLCMVAVNIATLWTAGLFALTHRPFDMTATVIPITILAYGVVDPVFVLTRFLSKLDSGRSKHDAIVESVSELAMPCTLTSVATALGFAAFAVSRAPTIRYYGLTVAVGVLLALVTTLTVLPLLLSLFPAPRTRFASLSSTRWLDRIFQSLWGHLQNHVGATVMFALLIIGVAAVFAREQVIDNQYVNYLPRGQTQENVRVLESKLAGVIRVIVRLEGAPDSMKRPDVLQAMSRLEQRVRGEPDLTVALSLADLIGEANQAFHDGDVAEHVVPESTALIGQYLALIEPSDLADYVTNDYAHSHIVFLMKDNGGDRHRQMIQRLEAMVAEARFSNYGIKATITGSNVLAYSEVDHVVVELLWGFATAFGLIILVQWILFRELRLALVSAIPNLVPVMICMIVMRSFGMELRIDSALSVCIAIGGLFNTTIHLIARARQRAAETQESPNQILMHALRAVGPASFFSTAILCAGFSVLLFSQFTGLRDLAVLSILTLAVGFLSDAIVTPGLVRLVFDWKRYAARQVAAPLAHPGDSPTA